MLFRALPMRGGWSPKLIALMDNAEEVLIATGDINKGTTAMRP